MKKQDNGMSTGTGIMLIGAAILLFVVAYSTFNGTSLFPGQITGGEGFTVNSITMSKVVSNDADLATANFIVTVTANGNGQSLVGEQISADEINSKLAASGSTVKAGAPLKIEMGNIKETLSYPIRNEGSLIKYGYEYTPSMNFLDSVSCPANTGYCYYLNSESVWWGRTWHAMAVNSNLAASYGKLDNPNINWAGKITVTAGTTAISQNIGSADKLGAADFYNGAEWIANAKWTGSLVTGQATPNPNLYVATQQSGGNWKVSASKYYDDYTSSKASTASDLNTLAGQYSKAACAKVYGECLPETPILNKISTHNGIVDILLNQNTKITYVSATGETLDQTITGSTIIETTNRRIANPQIVFLIKAKALNAYIPVGMPAIQSVSSPSFSSGDNDGVVTVTFKNVGGAKATFAATFTETSNTFYPRSNTESSKVSCNIQETCTINVLIGHATSSSATKGATITVYDVNKPANKDFRGFTITMTQPKKCVPLTQRVSGSIIYTCNADGLGETVQDCTGKKIEMTDNKFVCVSAGTPGTTTPPPLIDSKGKIYAWYEMPQGIAFIFLILILIVLGIRYKEAQR